MVEFKDCLQRLANGIKSLSNSNFIDPGAEQAAKVKMMYKAATQPGFMRRLDAYIRNMYLSALPTQVLNITSNVFNIASQPLITLGQSAFNKNVEAMDSLRMLKGMGIGAALAAPRFWKSLSGTWTQGGIGFVPESGKEAAYLGGGKISDTAFLNKLFTLPINMTKALDEGSKAILESMGTEVARARMIDDPRVLKYAQKQGIKPDELNTEIGNYLRGDVSKLDMLDQVTDIGKFKKEIEMFSDFNTYNQALGNSMIDKIAKKVEGIREALPGIGSFLVPFIKIPVNVAKEGAGYVPVFGEFRVAQAKDDSARVAEIMLKTRDKLLDAKRSYNQALKDPLNANSTEAALARVEKLTKEMTMLQGAKDFYDKMPSRFRTQQLIGAGLAASTVSLAYNGQMTGHFYDPQTRAKMQALGIPETSVKIGDRWVNYGRIEPFATVMGLTADFVQYHKDMAAEGKSFIDPKLVEVAPKIFAQNFLNKTFTESLGQMYMAIQDPGRYGSWYANLAGGVVPSFITQVAKAQDPIQRQTKEGLNSVPNVIKSRIPGLRETLAPQVDILGEPVMAVDSPVEAAIGKTPLTPLVEAVVGLKPREQNVVQAALMNPYVKVGAMSKKALGVELTPKQIATMKTQAGQSIAAEIYEQVSDPSFKTLSRPEQAARIHRIFERERRMAAKDIVGELIEENPDIEIEVEKRKRKRRGDIPDTAF